MDKAIEKTIDGYLKSVTDENTGECWTSHFGADYVYWSTASERDGATSYPINADNLNDKGLVEIRPDCIILTGPNGDVTLPLEFDFKKIRRRVEDALRKTATDQNILKIADILNIKLI
jgi:hypothetical protein